MERIQFLESLGISTAFVLTASCLQSCKKDDTGGTIPTPTDVDFTLNIDGPSNAALKINGGFVISNGIVFVKDKDGKFVAATQTYSQTEFKTVKFDNTKNESMCTTHGARFDTIGKGLNSEGSNNLTI